jgi:hypothetical protein
MFMPNEGEASPQGSTEAAKSFEGALDLEIVHTVLVVVKGDLILHHRHQQLILRS